MQVESVGSGSCSNCASLFSILRPEDNRAANLFNIINPPPDSQDLTDKPWWSQNTATTIFDHMLAFSQSLYEQDLAKEEKLLAPTIIQMYLQYPNESLQRLADKITRDLIDNDDKATAIIRWVLRNFPYQTDEANYGRSEMWSPPTFSLSKGSGDCEDGAFLVHSLLLHAGIAYDRIRTYGGLVKSDEGAEFGGHAWTAYRRESDDEWVILDTSYYPTLEKVEDRPMMKNAARYLDNFFYFDKMYWVNLEDLDRIHHPGAIYTYSPQGILKNEVRFAGALIDAVA